jgi:hypothetical protein
MKSLIGLLVGVAFFVLPGGVLCQTTKSSLADLGWIGGCWEMSIPERNLQINEQWMKPAGGMMIGAGRTVKAGKTVDHEFLRIVEDVDGIFYVAKPTGNKEETRFKLIRASASEIVFENPTHDFPQRVMYKREGDKLNARIEGIKDGKPRGIDFPYVRVKCE